MKNNMAITVKGIEKSFKELKVIKGINFNVQKGTIFALLGLNGAGKTTLIRILSTLLKPDKGTAEICNFDVIHQAHNVRKKISLTGQYSTVDELLTGKENLNMIGKLFHLSNLKERIKELLERFNLVEASNRRVITYSGGMKRKLDLAMSLIANPSVLFLDEPTTGLDPQSRLAIWKIIKKLTGNGTTVFLTTQYLEEAEQLADQIAILKEGKIVANGTVNELKKLLPDGYIEIGFDQLTQMQRAYELLKSYNIEVNEENMIITITSSNDIKEISNIINILEKANISITTFGKKFATLEDVFFSITGKEHIKGKEYEVYS